MRGLKVRDSDFHSSLYEFRVTDNGIDIRETPETAEYILGGGASRSRGSADPDQG